MEVEAKRKTSVNVHLGRFWFEAGWFMGNPPCLFHFELGMAINDYPEGISDIVLLGLQIAKAAITVGVEFK